MTSWQPFDDPLLADDDGDGPEPPAWLKQMILDAARASIAREEAEREAVARLGPRGKRKHMRRRFFEALRNGESRAAAAAAADIPNALLADWMRSPKFMQSVDRAELSASRAVDDFRL